MIARQKRIKHCESIADGVIFQADHFTYKSCIGNYRDPSFSYILSLYNIVKSGTNPFGGSYSDIPNKLYEIGNIIDNLVSEKQARDAEQQSKGR